MYVLAGIAADEVARLERVLRAVEALAAAMLALDGGNGRRAHLGASATPGAATLFVTSVTPHDAQVGSVRNGEFGTIIEGVAEVTRQGSVLGDQRLALTAGAIYGTCALHTVQSPALQAEDAVLRIGGPASIEQRGGAAGTAIVVSIPIQIRLRLRVADIQELSQP
jgi:hypothetical protein